MSAAPSPAAAPIADFTQARFDRALEELHDADPRAREAEEIDGFFSRDDGTPRGDEGRTCAHGEDAL